MFFTQWALIALVFQLKTMLSKPGHTQKQQPKNIDTFRRQLKALGFSYDWDREIATSDVDYYKWTQWIFTKLYNHSLAYEDEIFVNWCPELQNSSS